MPAGKALFFPLINAFDVHVPGDGLDTPELVRQDLLSFWGTVTALHASVDGEDVAIDLFDFGTCAGGNPDCLAAFSLQLPGPASSPDRLHCPGAVDRRGFLEGLIHPQSQ